MRHRVRGAHAPGLVAIALPVVTLALLGLTACSSSAPEPAPTSSPSSGGSAECTIEAVTAAVRADFEANYPGSTFVSLDGFACEGGWAKADATFEASGDTFPTVVVLRAQDGSWTAVTIEDACSTPPEESGMPASIYADVCGES